MSTITEVDTLSSDARNTFSPITGVPVDNDIFRLTKLLIRLCLSVRFHGTDVGCASGIVLSNAPYKRAQSTSTSFDRMIAPLAIYDPAIISYTTGSHRSDERKWAAKLINQSLIPATKQGARDLVLAVVKDTWTHRLKDANMF